MRTSKWFVACVAALCLLLFARGARAQECVGSLRDFETAGYAVRRVKAVAPLRGVFGSEGKGPQKVLDEPDVPRQAGQPFRISTADAVGVQLKEKINALRTISDAPVRVRFYAYTLTNCDAAARQLDIEYKVYLFQPGYYLSRTFEFNDEEKDEGKIEGTDKPDDKPEFFKKVSVRPFAGYDHSRRGYGGAQLIAGIDNPFIQNVEVDGAGSTTSAAAKVKLNGQKDSETSWLRHQEWRVNFRYSDTPADVIDLQEALGTFQYYGATRGFTERELLLRFGGSVEAGNKRSDVTAVSLGPGVLQRSPVLSFKGFAGTTFNLQPHHFKISYGLQLSGAEGGKSLDYAKHLLDSAASLKLGSLTADLRFSAGKLATYGNVPINERFFGGNAETNFLDSEAWHINSNPAIRSFSPYRLTSPSGTNTRGGDSFQALSMTLVIPGWREPLVPKEVWYDPTRPNGMKDEITFQEAAGFSAGEEQLTNEYLRGLPEFKPFRGVITDFIEEVEPLRGHLEALPRPNPDSDIQQALDELFDQTSVFGLQSSEKTLKTLLEDFDKGLSITSNVEALAVPVLGENSISQDLTQRLDIIAKALSAAGETEKAQDFSQRSARIEALRRRMVAIYETLSSSPKVAEAREKAIRDLVYPRRIFRYFLKEADLASVNPVLFLDAARLKQRETREAPWHYGAGGGVKFRLILAELTAGYSWNLRRNAGEPRGAAIFRFDILDIFKK